MKVPLFPLILVYCIFLDDDILIENLKAYYVYNIVCGRTANFRRY